MSHTVKTLRPKHQEIIRLAFQGLAYSRIAGVVGMSTAAVSCILRSPLAKAEIERLRLAAEEKLTNVPLKARMLNELEGASEEALCLNRKLMNESTTDLRVRVGIAKHFLDRVVFGDNGDEKEGTYREILRRLDTIQRDGGVVSIDKAVIFTGNPSS